MVEMEVRKVTKGVESNMVAFDFEHTPITQIADYIIITASNNGVSDIHFDPRDDNMMVRFRIDGDLQDYTCIPKLYERTLTTRIKLLASMNITESRLPQDGAIKGEFGGKYLDMRVSCLPLNTGEKIVIRILDYTRSLQGVDNLGFNQTNLKKIRRMMGAPNGIILVTGATGSGKSTTVYSVLQELNKPEINIITVEDPIEMNIEGMNQVQVNSEIGMTFAAALRSILRQDPNIILIGEIRDSETAQIAVRASITGHLVLSTIHTNNALSTIERLLDMDVERYLLSTSLTGIIAQRLAKKLCMTCRIERETTKYEKKVFKKFMNRDVEKIYDANPKGCENCRKGYKGRIAIHEVLELDEEIRNALANSKLTKDELSEMVYGSKTITMLQDALGKAISGLTSFEEVYRVIELETEPGDDTAYLTKSIEDIPDDTKTKEQTSTDDLDFTIKSPEQKNINQNNVQGIPKFNINGTEIKDIKNITNNTVNNQVNNQSLPTQAIPAHQQPPTGILPQVATLTKEQQKAQAEAQTLKKAQENAIKKEQSTIVQPTLLTPEQAKIQAETAKAKLKEQVEKENEKKLTEVLAKPQNVTNQKLIVANPNLKPTPVAQPSQQKQQTNQQLAKEAQPTNLYQLPKSTSEQISQPKIPQPKIEKMEKAIPELNISIKTNQEKPLVPKVDESPLVEKENTFEEKDKVKEIDINKISQSTDLKIDEKVINNPLTPTIKTEEDKKESIVPIIIESFAVDDELKAAPKLSEIKMDTIKKDELITADKDPIEKVTKLSTNTQSTTANTVASKKEVAVPIDKLPEEKSKLSSPITKSEPQDGNKKVVATSTKTIPEINTTTKKTNTVSSDSNKVNKNNILATPVAVAKAKNTAPILNEINNSPTKESSVPMKATTEKVSSKIDKPQNKSIIPKIEGTKTNNEAKNTEIKIVKTPTSETIATAKTTNFKLPTINTDKVIEKNLKISASNEAKDIINKEKENSFHLPALSNPTTNNIQRLKENTSIEMKQNAFDISKVSTTTKTETIKEDTSNTAKDSSTEKKPFITEMKQNVLNIPKASTTTKTETIKEDTSNTTKNSSTEKKPFITEMKQNTFDIPKTSTTTKTETIKEDNPNTTKNSSTEKKPFITEMKQNAFDIPKTSTARKTETIKEEPSNIEKNTSTDKKNLLNNESKQNNIVETKTSKNIETNTRATSNTKKIIIGTEKDKKDTSEISEKKQSETKKIETPPKIESNSLKTKNEQTKNDKNDAEMLDLNIDGELLSLGED